MLNIDKKRYIRLCPICNSGRAEILFTNVFASINEINLSYSVVKCNICDSVFANNLASPVVYSQYYSIFSKYALEEHIVGNDTSRLHKIMADIIAARFDKNQYIVDIGCGAGHFLSLLSSAGFSNAHGIEPAVQAPAVAEKLYGFRNIITGTLESFIESEDVAKVDVCCLGAVLEHLTDPYQQLCKIADKMKPGSFLLLEVPDLDAFNADLSGPYEELSLEHINYFSIRSMRQLIKRLGFEIAHYEQVINGQGGGSLVVLACKTAAAGVHIEYTNDANVMQLYIERSEAISNTFLATALAGITRKFVIYGAGSHTARLIPKLKTMDLYKFAVAIVDRNSNLWGANMDGIPIMGRDSLADFLETDILVSSYRFEKEIIASLQGYSFGRVLPIYGEKLS